MSTSKAQKLMERLDRLREEEPVLWAVVRGATTPLKIWAMTGFPPKRLEEDLRQLVIDRHITHYMGKAYLLNKRGDRFEALQEAAKLADLIEAKTVEGSKPEAVLEIIGVLSMSMRTKIKAEQSTKSPEGADQAVRHLTEKQQKAWDNISSWLENRGRGGEPFTTKEAALAQGFSKPGFMKNALLALVKKDRVRHIEGRPEKWVLLD